MPKTFHLDRLPDDLGMEEIGDSSRLSPDILGVLRELAFRKAMANRVFFLENFWTVQDPFTMEFVPFKLRDYQHTAQAWIEAGMVTPRWRGIEGKARQLGATTQVAASAMHDMLSKPNHSWLISSQTDEDAKETLGSRMKDSYTRLPDWLKTRLPQLLNDSVESMRFGNGSRVLSVPSTSKSGRGKVVFGVILDEAAHAENAHEVFTALDPMCYGPMYVLSTGNGMGNFFHEKWVDSERYDSEWRSIFFPWHVVPGRDQQWYEREKRKYRGQLWRFYQEYPSSPEEMFAKTGLSVFPMDLLRDEQEWYPPVQRIDLDMHWQSLRTEAVFMEPDEEDEMANELWVWEPPTVERDDKGRVIRTPNYVMFVDAAEGLPHGDRSSITVFNANTGEEAASYRGWWPIEDLAELTVLLANWYHQALIVPERNNQGITVINDIKRMFEYPRVYRMTSLATIPKGERTPRYGWVTTPASKAKMVTDFIRGLREGTILLHDVRFLEEAGTFVRTDKGGFAASGSNYDDHVISHIGAWQGVLEVGEYPTIWYDDSVKKLTWGDIVRMGESRSPQPDLPFGHTEIMGTEMASFIL